MHKMEAPCTVAGGDQRALIISFTVADPVVEGNLVSKRRASKRNDDAVPEGQFFHKPKFRNENCNSDCQHRDTQAQMRIITIS